MLLLIAVTAFACKRIDKPTETPPSENTAGKGGNASIEITSRHHGNNIDSVTVYIKYNSSDAGSVYDDSAKAVHDIDGKPVASFGSLKKGKYYLYGRGWDTTISNNVVGGIPLSITEDRKYEISLSVTEGD